MRQSKLMVKNEFLSAIRGVPSDKPLIWIMRQAGRFLKSYRDIKEKHSFSEMCTTPELASRITMMPLEQINVDAMILFSDILIPLKVLGAEISYKANNQPAVKLDLSNINYERNIEHELPFIKQTVKIIKDEYKEKPLIGFAGAPFTVVCYMLGGGKEFYKARAFLYDNPKQFKKLMSIITRLTIDYLKMQIASGCDAVQLFDSWAGILPNDIYKTFVYPYNQQISEALSDTPSIYYIKDSTHIIDDVLTLGFDCISIDWRLDIKSVSLKSKKCIQGNMDNAVLLSDRKTIKNKAYDILNAMRDRAHIFNLGHGILPQTDEDSAKYLVDIVHAFR